MPGTAREWCSSHEKSRRRIARLSRDAGTVLMPACVAVLSPQLVSPRLVSPQLVSPRQNNLGTGIACGTRLRLHLAAQHTVSDLHFWPARGPFTCIVQRLGGPLLPQGEAVGRGMFRIAPKSPPESGFIHSVSSPHSDGSGCMTVSWPRGAFAAGFVAYRLWKLS